MEISIKIRTIFFELVCYLYILLFVYTAVSKIIDFENFIIQISQSIVISPFTHWIVWLIPVIEFIIASALITQKWKTIALYAAFLLMVIFSTYIYIILNFIPDIPCSCGGVLENMSWNEHLIFNIAFVVLGLVAIFLQKCNLRRISIVSLLFFIGIASVFMLYKIAANQLQRENPFIRIFHSKWVNFESEIDLNVNSYYFAGFDKNNIYLANYTSPIHLLQIDTTLSSKKERIITLEDTNIPIKKVIIQIRPPYFYWFDGSVPLIMTGNSDALKVTSKQDNLSFFTQIETLTNHDFIIRTNNAKNGENIIGTFNLNTPLVFHSNSNLLEKQKNSDGIFETEGSLFHDPISKKAGYVYRYKNGYVLTDYHLNEMVRGKTIDTFYRPNIKIKKNEKGQMLASLPTIVNNKIAAYNHLLFINSPLRGQFDPLEAWQNNATVDVYHLASQQYEFSFYITLYKEQKLHSFIVVNSSLYALVGNKLVKYSFSNEFKTMGNNTH
jgi:hypothetical protein